MKIITETQTEASDLTKALLSAESMTRRVARSSTKVQRENQLELQARLLGRAAEAANRTYMDSSAYRTVITVPANAVEQTDHLLIRVNDEGANVWGEVVHAGSMMNGVVVIETADGGVLNVPATLPLQVQRPI